MKNFLLALMTLFVLGCQNSRSDKAANFDQSVGEAEMAAPRSAEPPPPPMSKKYKDESASYENNTANDQKSPVFQKKIIKTANIKLEVDDFDQSIDHLRKLLKSFKAEIFRESENRSPYNLSNNIVIKVVPEEFDLLVVELTKLGINVLRKDINSSDVSDQYYDVKTRLKSKRAVLARYTAILKSAKTIDDILSVEEKLRVITEEIEAAEGRLRFLNAQVGMSTINLSLTQDIERPNVVTKSSFWKKLSRSFSDGFSILKGFILGLVTLWPFLLFIPLGVWGFRRIRRRFSK